MSSCTAAHQSSGTEAGTSFPSGEGAVFCSSGLMDMSSGNRGSAFIGEIAPEASVPRPAVRDRLRSSRVAIQRYQSIWFSFPYMGHSFVGIMVNITQRGGVVKMGIHYDHSSDNTVTQQPINCGESSFRGFTR
jgi:hypothetical protein